MAQVSALSQFAASPMTPAEDDAVIHARLMNDERIIRRIARNFNTLTSSSSSTSDDPTESSKKRSETRDALLADLALLQSQLTTRHLIVSAETHQVTTYASSRLQIDQDQLRLQGEIVQLNSVLAEEQVYRKRKLEYDAIAEKANLFPSRAELGEAIGTLEEEIAGIEAELEREERAMEARREAFDVVVRELQVLRLMGKEPEEEPVEEQGGERARSASPADDDDTRRDAKRPATEVIDEHGGRSTPTAQLNANARPFRPRLVSGLGDADAEMHVDTGDGDIEMGEVAETLVASKPAVKITLPAEEREEGEASPTSALSEL